MSWAKLDDRANEHRKCLAAGAEACWFWSCGLMYANRQPARDGFIPELVLTMLYPVKNPKKLAAKLVDVGLWERIEGGYRIHDYHVLNPTKEQYEASLAEGRARAAKSYENRKAKTGVSSREELPKTRESSGVVWSGTGQGSGDLDLESKTTDQPGSPGAREPDALISAAKLWLADPQAAAFAAPNPEKWADSQRLVAVVAEVFGGPAQPIRHSGDPRMRVLFMHWAEGRSTDELEQAVRGAGKDDHLLRNPQLQTLTTILRDANQVDRFSRLLTVAPVVPLAKGTGDRGADQLTKQLARVAAAREAETTEPRKALPQ